MRLIDEGELLKALGFEESKLDMVKPGSTFDVILNAPTIDAEPVRHGTWIEERGDLHSSGRVVTCPLCHKQHFIPSRTMSWWVSDESVFQKPDRCRSCGAKMDGGGKR